MTDILQKFNLSYSALNTYKQSQLQFYYQYLIKSSASDTVNQSYGKAGNILHDVIAGYIDGSIPLEDFTNKFDGKWNAQNLLSFRGLPLDKVRYLTALQKAKKIVDGYGEEYLMKAEKRFEFHHQGILIKAFIDLIAQHKDDKKNIFIIDWKTDSQSTEDKHLLQRQFYNWVFIKFTGTMQCHAIWYYLCQNKFFETYLTAEDAQEFEETVINPFIKEIQEKGFDKNNYELGDYKHPFNPYRTMCDNELLRRANEAKYLKYKITIKGTACYLTGDVDDNLIKGLDYKFKFDLPDKHFMQEAAKKNKRGAIDLRDVGTIHMFSVSRKAFNLGHLTKVQDMIHEYGVYKHCKIEIKIDDQRTEIENGPSYVVETEKTLRYYQSEAIAEFIREKIGIIQAATGSGKTFIAAHIIATCNTNTLWIIDRKELLWQTKEELEKMLPEKIGVIGNGEINILGKITIATVQTLASQCNTPVIKDYLASVNLVIVDEFHKSAAESYLKVFSKLTNAKYRLGMSATPYRNDGKTPILHSLLGDIIYTYSTQKGIEDGYLIKPKIRFFKTPAISNSKDYVEDYRENIVLNIPRNGKIISSISTDFRDKKILILTKQVAHGKYLQSQITDRYSCHITGKTPDDIRKEMMKKFRDNPNAVLVTTNQIAAEGLDIPELDVIINAAANKGDVKSIQVLGRVLRQALNKKEAIYIDFVDNGFHTASHSEKRIKAFEEQGHEVEII